MLNILRVTTVHSIGGAHASDTSVVCPSTSKCMLGFIIAVHTICCPYMNSYKLRVVNKKYSVYLPNSVHTPSFKC